MEGMVSKDIPGSGITANKYLSKKIRTDRQKKEPI